MNPTIIEDSLSIPANTIRDNVIALNPSLRGLLQAPFPFRGEVMAVGSVTGLRLDFDYSSKNVIANSQPRVDTNLSFPDDVLNANFFGNEGDQLALRANNITAGAIVLRYRITLFPMVDANGNAMELPPDTRAMQQGPIIVANNSVDQQVLDGLRYERLPVPSVLEVLMTASAAGLTRSLYIEQDRIAPPSAINATNRIPQDPFDSTIDGVEVPANHLQQLQITNLSGGALNVFWKTKNTELFRT